MFALAAAALAACDAAVTDDDGLAGSVLIDLTYAYDRDTVYWPTSDPFAHETVFAGVTEGGYYYSAYKFRTAEHGGTHLDAPIHFNQAGQTADQVPLERLVGPAVVVDVSARAKDAPDYLVSVADLEAWERENGRLEDGRIVLIRTGWGARWPDVEAYLGTAERGPGAVAGLHFPGLAPDAARWLVDERAIKAVGIDTASIDYGQSTLYETHQILAAAQVPVFENVANLDGLPARGFQVVALPMKIAGGSGGPLRLIAVLPNTGL